jgi:hypothetical protein
MNQKQAEILALGDRDWTAIKRNGRWIVWSAASDHAVEFDQRTIDEAIQADYDLSRQCS